MTLILHHLASILGPDPTMKPRIPEIIEEQRVAELLDIAGDIVEHHEADPAAAIHIHGYEMASRLGDLARARRKHLVERCLDESDLGVEALADIDYADQLAAHHLDMLDRLGGSPATL